MSDARESLKKAERALNRVHSSPDGETKARREALKHIRAALADGGWRDMESAPRDGTRILAETPWGVETVKWVGEPDSEYAPKSGWIGVEQDSDCMPETWQGHDARCQPFRWCPLPTPPKGPGHD